MIRLICIDVDGTLIGSSGTVLPAVWSAAEQAREKGIRLAICSGRPAFGKTRDYAARLDAAGWHVFQNGASVVHLGSRESRSAALDAEILALLIARARQTGRVLELYTDSEYAVESTGDAARQHAALLGLPFTPRSFDSLAGTIVRAQWLVTRAELDAMADELRLGLEVSPATSPIMPGTMFVSLTARGVGKASAVRAVAAAYAIPLAEVMVVGDGHNDAAAMREVGFGVAMGNAEPEVQKVARFSVGHVDEGGLAEALAMALTA